MALQAFDRRIEIGVREVGTRNQHGEFVPGARTGHPVWAYVTDAGTVDIEAPEGIYLAQRRAFVVRFRLEFLMAGPFRLDVVDQYQIAFNVEEVTENASPGFRQRTMTITGIAVT